HHHAVLLPCVCASGGAIVCQLRRLSQDAVHLRERRREGQGAQSLPGDNNGIPYDGGDGRIRLRQRRDDLSGPGCWWWCLGLKLAECGLDEGVRDNIR